MPIVSRLIHYFVPEHYKISLELNRVGRNFRGIVTIDGALAANATSIVVHAKELDIESVLIDGKTAEYTRRENDEVVLTQPGLQPGKHIVVIGFRGHITDTMNGLYPCYYEHAGVKKELLATQFESHHAREVFPCIDEPEAKATFDLTLTTEADVVALSNMPIKFQDNDSNQTVTTFETSPRMSTYLLAFVVGELHKKTARTQNDVEINIWATPAQTPDSLDFAMDIAVRVTEFFEKYFSTAYPLPKCDHVALPDFAAGAMENWGLITYREAALLATSATSLSNRQYVARVIAHEISHQWFGNLVTMKWWDNLWLNESFATLMMYLSLEAIHPEWNNWLSFSTSQHILALDRDSIDGVQPVQTTVSHPDEINTLFDAAIVYAKGARLLRMLQHYVGDEAFQAGLKQYFQQFAYSNTEGDDLWNAISASSGKNITDLMNAWISQSGLPVVSVTRQNGQTTLAQQRFFVGPHKPSETLWPIPLDATDPNAPELLSDQSANFTASTPSIRLNQQDTAHFVTHYSDELFDAILDEVRGGQLPVIARIQTLNETALLARGGIVSSARLIPLINAYQNEESENVWSALSMILGELRKFVEDTPQSDQALRALTGRIAHKQYERLGWSRQPGETESDCKLRAIIIGLMVHSEDPEVIAQAKSLYDSTPIEELTPELRPIILKSVSRHGDEAIVDTLLDLYRKTSSSELQRDLLIGAAATRHPAKLAELLDALRDPQTIRPQDVPRWYIQLIRNKDGRDLTWQWIRDNWQWVIDTFGGSKNYDDYPRYTAMALRTPTELQEFKDFFEPKQDIPMLTRVITMGISEIEGRVELIERDQDAVRQALLQL